MLAEKSFKHGGQPMTRPLDREEKIRRVREVTSFLLHKHYCENDVEAIIGLFDDKLSWFGAGETEYSTGTERITGIFRQFANMVPKCNIRDEEYDVTDVSPEVYICTGRAWIATDPSTNIYLRAHQRPHNSAHGHRILPAGKVAGQLAGEQPEQKRRQQRAGKHDLDQGGKVKGVLHGGGLLFPKGKTVGVAGSGPHLLFPVYLPQGEKAVG